MKLKNIALSVLLLTITSDAFAAKKLPVSSVRIDTVDYGPGWVVIEYTNLNGVCINMWTNVRGPLGNLCGLPGGWKNVQPGEARRVKVDLGPCGEGTSHAVVLNVTTCG